MWAIKSLLTEAEELFLSWKWDIEKIPRWLGIHRAIENMTTNVDNIIDAANQASNIDDTPKEHKKSTEKTDNHLVYCGCWEVMRPVWKKKKLECPHCSWKQY